MKPQIVIENFAGYHNSKDYLQSAKESAYRDLSTICIVPTRGHISAKVVQSWMALMSPMNQKFTRMFVIKQEVGKAYSNAIDFIINDPVLSQWKYILTLEEDNCPPPDGLIKLYDHIDEYDAVGGIYFTKGEGGKPMCYGNPNSFPVNFIPFMPKENDITRCNGLGMGFTLFKLDMFKNPNLKNPFETLQSYDYGVGVKSYTQDLKFFEDAGKLGYKFACDSRVKVGHYDTENDMMW